MTEKKMVRKFEDLIAWQKARTLTREIYKATSAGTFAQDYGLRDQVRRAAVSIMSNLAEGFERGGRSEFHQFLSVAKSSCAELRSQLYVAVDAQHNISQENCSRLLAQAEEVARIIGGLRSAVQRQRDTGKVKMRKLRSLPQSSALSPQS
jgi:four helix bundle protein